MNQKTNLSRLGPFVAAASSISKAACTLALVLGGGLAALAAGADNRAPEVPDEIAVPGTTNKVTFTASE